MSEKELNSYRFTSGKEPTDEMLAQIMKEVAQEAAESNRKAKEAYFAKMRCMAAISKAKWAKRINTVLNG